MRLRSRSRWAIAPGARRLDVVVVLGKTEARSRRPLAHGGEPVEQGRAAGDHDAGMAAQDLRIAGRQVELAAPDIDPHVAVAHHHSGIARQPETGGVEQRGETLVGDLDVDVLEMDRVPEVLRGAVECLLHDGLFRKRLPTHHHSTEGRLRRC